MALDDLYDPTLDQRSRAYLAILQVREYLDERDLGDEAEPYVEGLVRLMQRTATPAGSAEPGSGRPRPRLRLVGGQE